MDELKQYYRDLGIPEEIIRIYTSNNLRIAKQVVEGYNFGREITSEEKKALLQEILNNSKCKGKNNTYVRKLIENLNKKGNLTEQEIYGIIIRLAVDGGIDKYSYTWMLQGSMHVEKFIEHYVQNKEEIDLSITKTTIQRAIAYNLSKEDEEQLAEYYRGLGVPDEFIKSKSTKNLYATKQIIDGYNFERELRKREKGQVLQSILKNVLLDKENRNLGRLRFISILMQRLERLGFNEQERYGIIINSAVSGGIDGHNYSDMLNSSKPLEKFAKHYIQNKERIDLNVNEATIQRAMADNSTKEEEERLKEEFERFGIIREFLDSKNTRNLYSAKQIVEGCNFGREITDKEK
ncbi:MAG: hypothetical protein FWC68_00735 [Oscillospiraceae bacterium]|nr:hypothetical protein [Oscillospiraceae bacterium]